MRYPIISPPLHDISKLPASSHLYCAIHASSTCCPQFSNRSCPVLLVSYQGTTSSTPNTPGKELGRKPPDPQAHPGRLLGTARNHRRLLTVHLTLHHTRLALRSEVASTSEYCGSYSCAHRAPKFNREGNVRSPVAAPLFSAASHFAAHLRTVPLTTYTLTAYRRALIVPRGPSPLLPAAPIAPDCRTTAFKPA